MREQWNTQQLHNVPCTFLQRSINVHGFIDFQRFPNVSELTSRFSNGVNKRFIDQSTMRDNGHYYDMRIALDHEIPTRPDNWHDFFNALVWLQFPRSKHFISQTHTDDIQHQGSTTRTPRRDRLTHFDECGLLLLVKEKDCNVVNSFIRALATHDWEAVFHGERTRWHSDIIPCLFGHASMEMFLSPFIGMTAKWLVVLVSDDFEQLSLVEQLNHIDQRLLRTLNDYKGLASKQILRPIPLLGVPGWFDGQDKDFYQNGDYFRAQREGIPLTEQYPIRILEDEKH